MESMARYPGLARAAESLCDLRLGPPQLEALKWYSAELRVWSQRTNLSAIRDPEAIEIKHFLDSLSCSLALELQSGDRLVDIGSGAGFPSLPLRIAFPALEVTLIESIGKKADFCRHVIKQLDLSGAEVLHARAELVGRDPAYRSSFQWAVARAVARLPALLEYALPLLEIGGKLIAQKGDSGPSEAQTAVRALELLGGRLQRVLSVELPGVAETRHLIVVEKVVATPSRYPRRPGIPAKRPL
jgi:16S rRNA (guanine527-N7)-methyltransferase